MVAFKVRFALAVSGLLACASLPYLDVSAKVAEVVAPVQKVVSLAPSNTELIYSIGAESKLVGVSTFCDYPPAVKKKEKVGSFVSAQLERLVRLKPDTVLLVSGQETLSILLSRNNFKVRVLPNTKLNDISANTKELGVITGHSAQAQALSSDFDRALAELNSILSKAKMHPKIFYCVWPQPLLTVGRNSFLNDVITVCGGTNIAATATAAYPNFSAEKLLLSDPDIVILPFEAKGKISLERAPWSSLRAVKQQHTYYLPQPEKNGLIRPTLRIINGLTWLSERLHPELTEQLRQWQASNAAKLKVASQ